VTTTLLAIDDSKTMRKVLEITFAGEQFRTITAEGPGDARGLIAAQRPGVVIIDANLPNGAGYDLCREIKSSSPGTLVLMLANKQQPYDKARGTADEVADKPFDTQQLIDRVAALIKRGPSAAVAAAPAPVAPAPIAPAPMAAAPRAPIAPAAPAPSPVSPAVAARPRSSTLAYGAAATPSPSEARVAPVAAAPASSSTLTGQPAVAPAPRPLAPVVPVAPAPVVARPVVAPAPVAAPAAVAPVAAAVNAQLGGKLQGLGLTEAQVEAVLALSKSVVEQVVWEVVPVLAETLIKEELARLTAD
jgi:CheY-like chemotaxis protein